jgi:hypothetical protein
VDGGFKLVLCGEEFVVWVGVGVVVGCGFGKSFVLVCFGGESLWVSVCGACALWEDEQRWRFWAMSVLGGWGNRLLFDNYYSLWV